MEVVKERVEVQQDSFEQIDRILKIAEEYNREYRKETLLHQLSSWIRFLAAVVLAYGIVEVTGARTDASKFPTVALVAFSIGVLLEIAIRVFYTDPILKKIKQYKSVTDQAIEIIRETYPFISIAENWSPLRKFELKLRLSQLGIAETTLTDIFSDSDTGQKKPMFDKRR
jgi:hypothetical protein